LPKKGVKLFSGAKDWQHNACVGYMDIDMSWDAYAEGFKTAADQIVEDILENRVGPIDVLVYPVVFLYRQYLELRLKELIIVGARLHHESADVPIKHDLLKLWALVRPRLEEVWPTESTREYNEAVEEGLRQFCDVDPGSYAFRYPVDNKGVPVLGCIDHINLRQVKDVIAGISTVLDGSSIGMGEYLDAKHEMLAEYRSETAALQAEMRAEMDDEMRQFYEP
jgi:hypothetical protein